MVGRRLRSIGSLGLFLTGLAAGFSPQVPAVDAQTEIRRVTTLVSFNENCEGRVGRFPVVTLERTNIPEYEEGATVMGPNTELYFPFGEFPPQVELEFDSVSPIFLSRRHQFLLGIYRADVRDISLRESDLLQIHRVERCL